MNELEFWLRAQIASERYKAEKFTKNPYEGWDDDRLHIHGAHPAYEYATTEGQRKAWPYVDDPPEQDAGWELNTTSRHPDAWERFEYTEQRYWRRLLPDGPVPWKPAQGFIDMLAQCEAHEALLDLCTPGDGEQLQLAPETLNVMDSVVRDVALAYQHRLGYREAWRP